MVLIQRDTVRSTKEACQNILKGSIRKDIKQIICYRSGKSTNGKFKLLGKDIMRGYNALQSSGKFS